MKTKIRFKHSDFYEYLSSLNSSWSRLTRIIVLLLFVHTFSCESAVFDSDQTVTDIDGNVYETVRIGSQKWMAENLRVTRFQDGTPIANVTNSFEWNNTNSPAWVYYENNSDYDTKYGKLYNWYTVSDDRGICPEGWYVPDKASWNLLDSYLGDNQGSKLKTAGTEYWGAENTRATNETGFSALPGGLISSEGEFDSEGSWGYWWSSSSLSQSNAHSYVLATIWETSLPQWGSANKNNGFSIRCIKDSDPTAQYYFESAQIKIREKDYNNAIQDLNKAVALDSNDTAFYFARGEAKYALSDFQGVIEDMNKIIELDPNESDAYGYRAFAFWELGEQEKALNELKDFVKYSENVDKYQGHRTMAELLFELDKHEKALVEMNKSIELAYKYVEDENKISELYEYRGNIKAFMEDGKGMLNDWNRSLELNPDNSMLYIMRGHFFQELQDHESAVSDFLSAINLKPFRQEIVMAYLRIGISYYHLNNLQLACFYWDTATQLGNEVAHDLMAQYCN